MRPIEIAGGGLAGLSLARALARAGVPTRLHERDAYPRHKVCGEFITGLSEAARTTLDLDPVLAGALEHRRTTWFCGERRLFTRSLPAPALGLSRWTLDARLAEAARAAGAEVREHARAPREPLPDAGEGWVWATGVPRRADRPAESAGWVALKVHLGPLPLAGDLELHLGRGGYAGLSGIEDGRVNLCMLLRTDACTAHERRTAEGALRAIGLGALAARAEAAGVVEGSRKAIAGFALGRAAPEPGGPLSLGDRWGAIAPFTGHGMAMALESAARALGPLVAYARGEQEWGATRASVAGDLRRHFRRRLEVAGILHRFVLRPPWQGVAAHLAQTPLFPWRLLYRATHS